MRFAPAVRRVVTLPSLNHMIALPSFRNFARRALTLSAVACSPLFLGGWSWIHGPQSTFDAEGPVARAQLEVFYVTVWVTMIIFVIVGTVLAYASIKFKARNAADEHAEPPPQGHGNPLVELGLIGASVLALVFIAIPTVKNIWYTYDVPESEKANSYEVTAIGYQWWFKFEYVKEQIEANGAKTNLVTANELVVPAGRAIHVNLRTVDVIHSWWVPKLAGKVDMIPNRGNYLWFKADKPGYYWGQCAEYCGESHAVMRFRVIALGEQEWAEWLQKQKAAAVQAPAAPGAEAPKAQFASYAIEPAKRNAPGWTAEFDADPLGAWRNLQKPATNLDPALVAQGAKLFADKTCVACHTVRGRQDALGVAGPDLTHIGSRSTIAAGLLENNSQNLHRWLVAPNDVKPGNKMWFGGYKARVDDTWVTKFELNDGEARALVAYLQSLK